MTPTNEADLAEAVASASGPLCISGGNTRRLGNPVDGAVLNLSGLRGVSLYEPGALTLVAGAGTPVEEIRKLLASEGQRLAFESTDFRSLQGTSGAPTIGGVVASNSSGPRRIQVGACRDALLGVRFVDGRGQILKNGGRVMKNVTGYDLVKLIAGSFGSLGVLSEVSLKVLPKAEVCGVVLINGLDEDIAIRALSRALGSPFDVSAAAHVPKGIDGHPVTMIRLEGFEASVRYRAESLCEVLQGFGEAAIETDPERTEAGWKWVRDVEVFHARSGDVWRISVKPSDGPVVGEILRRSHGAELLYDWGGGLVWAMVPQGSDIRPALAGIAGHATVVRASDETKNSLKVFQSQGPVLDRIAAELRAKFDPSGILNAGIMG